MNDDPRYQLCKVCGAKDCDCTIMDWVNKPHIENAALRAEVEQLRMALADTEALELGTAERCKRWRESYKMQEQQLAASQLEAKRLRDTMQKIAGHPEETPPFYWWQIYARNALSSPTSTDALDAYVAERIKDAHEDGHNEGLSYSAPTISELTRQRDLAVSALECYVPELPQGTTEAEKALAAIKESGATK